MTLTRRSTAALSLLALGIGGFAGCSSEGLSVEDGVTAGPPSPATVDNCGAEVVFERVPQRLVLLRSASVPALHELGVLDRAVARAGAYPEEYFDEATLAELRDIPQLGGDVDGTGHLQISKETVIAQKPDLVFGEIESLPRASLAQAGIPLLEEPAMCASGADPSPDYDAVYEQLRLYGEVFDAEEAAENTVAELQDRVRAATETGHRASEEEETRSAAVLYPTVGGGTTYAYGTASMAHAQLEAAGFTNAFEGTSERVFEIGSEELLGRDPDVLILLHSEGGPEPVADAVRQLAGGDELTAVKNDDVLVQLLNFSEPATPLAVTGLERIVDRFAS